MTQGIPPGAEERAYVLFTDFIAGRGEEVHRELEARLRDQVPVDWFARVGAKAASSVGTFERMVVLPAQRSGGYTVVDVLLTFAAGDGIGEAIFDHHSKVAGLSLEFPYPRPPRPDPETRWGGGGIRTPEVAGLMRFRP